MNTLTFDNHWEAKTNSFNKRMDKMREELCRYEAKHHLREKTICGSDWRFFERVISRGLAIFRDNSPISSLRYFADADLQVSRWWGGLWESWF